MDLFTLGKVVATRGALNALEKAEQHPYEFINRHKKGDWGNVPEEDKKENDFSVKNGFRILSSYTTNEGDTIWVVTERDRSSTSLLLPSEY